MAERFGKACGMTLDEGDVAKCIAAVREGQRADAEHRRALRELKEYVSRHPRTSRSLRGGCGAAVDQTTTTTAVRCQTLSNRRFSRRLVAPRAAVQTPCPLVGRF